MRRHPPHHLSPARANHPAGQDPEARLSRPSHHSNAPIKPESQSILSKIVALTPSKGSFEKSSSASIALAISRQGETHVVIVCVFFPSWCEAATAENFHRCHQIRLGVDNGAVEFVASEFE